MAWGARNSIATQVATVADDVRHDRAQAAVVEGPEPARRQLLLQKTHPLRAVGLQRRFEGINRHEEEAPARGTQATKRRLHPRRQALRRLVLVEDDQGTSVRGRISKTRQRALEERGY